DSLSIDNVKTPCVEIAMKRDDIASREKRFFIDHLNRVSLEKRCWRLDWICSENGRAERGEPSVYSFSDVSDSNKPYRAFTNSSTRYFETSACFHLLGKTMQLPGEAKDVADG